MTNKLFHSFPDKQLLLGHILLVILCYIHVKYKRKLHTVKSLLNGQHRYFVDSFDLM